MKWEKLKLGDVCELVYGKSLKKDNRTEGGKYPVYGSSGVIGRHDEYTSDGPTIVIGRKGSIGTVYYSEQPCWTIDTAYFVRPTNKFNPRYLYYQLKTLRLHDLDKSAAIPGLSRTDVYEKMVFIPPLPVQKQIADTLDKADALRRKDQELRQKYEELAQSIFYDMFGNPVQNERGWSKRQLVEVCDQITDGTHFSPPSVLMGVPYITAKHVKATGIDFYSDPTYVSKEDHEEIYSRCKPAVGDLLYIKDGATTGIAAINEYDFPFSMLSSLALIKPNSTLLNNQYLMYWLNNSTVKDMYIREYMAGAAIKRFTLQKIKQFRINVPPLKLQSEFGRIVKKLSETRKVKEQSCKISSELFETLLNQNFS